MLKVQITKVDLSTGKNQVISDCVAQEKPLYVFLNRTHYATIFCSPTNLKELAIGHVISEGLVKSIGEFDHIDLRMAEGVCYIRLIRDVNLTERMKISKHFSRVIFSACGAQTPFQPSARLPKIRSSLTVRAGMVLDCVNRLNHIAEIFRKTGGVHVAAIYKADGTLVSFAEDVGRHNAVDKAIGIAALNRAKFSECMLSLSGRLTSDVVFKAVRSGLPIVASLAAATNTGIDTAKNYEVTLIGFARGKRMNIYTCPERISV